MAEQYLRCVSEKGRMLPSALFRNAAAHRLAVPTGARRVDRVLRCWPFQSNSGRQPMVPLGVNVLYMMRQCAVAAAAASAAQWIEHPRDGISDLHLSDD